MYRYNESGRHRLTREMILRDLKEEDKGSSPLAVGLIIAVSAISLLTTAIMALVSLSAGMGAWIVCGIVWVCAAVVIRYAVAILIRARKPLTPADIRVVKRRLTAIEQDKYPPASASPASFTPSPATCSALRGLSPTIPAKPSWDWPRWGTNTLWWPTRQSQPSPHASTAPTPIYGMRHWIFERRNDMSAFTDIINGAKNAETLTLEGGMGLRP